MPAEEAVERLSVLLVLDANVMRSARARFVSAFFSIFVVRFSASSPNSLLFFFRNVLICSPSCFDTVFVVHLVDAVTVCVQMVFT